MVILDSRRRHYAARASVFLITVALMAGMAGCAPAQYDLTISSTEGGEVTIPGEGEFTYNEGTVVDLVAEADEGYQFVNWTGYVDSIADVTAAATNITMNDHHTIIANFALPMWVWDWYDLDAIRDGMGGIYILMNDLDSTTAGYTELASPTANGGAGWQPIGTSDNQFTGIFDGQGYEICDLFINRPDEDWAGFFGIIRGRIKGVGVVNATVTGDYYVGGLVGVVDSGTVSNSYFTGTVTGDVNVGGLVGGSSGPVSNSYSTGSVTGNSSVGGLVGENCADTVSSCYSTGSVTGDSSVGGLVGANEAFGTVSNSYSTGNVTGDEHVGGLVGSNIELGTMSNCYSTGSVTGDGHVGGLVGYSERTVSNSFWDTETSGRATSDGGTGKTTAQMKSITTFSGAAWDIIAVANPSTRNPSYIWNIVTEQTYPFLSWQP